jgi:hypothetical protein
MENTLTLPVPQCAPVRPPVDDPLRAARGIVLAMPLSLVLWAALWYAARWIAAYF